MTGLLLPLCLLVAAEGWLDLPAVRRGEVTAQLALRVGEPGVVPGQARIDLRLRVTGPPGLQVDGPRLDDALAAWRLAWLASSWSADGSELWELTGRLEQSKAGAVPLPGVRLRFRAGAGAAWNEAAWPEPLHDPRDAAGLIELPEEVAPPPGPLPLAALLLVCVLAAVLLVRRRWRRRDRPLPSAEQLLGERIDATLRDHDPGRQLVGLAAALRAYLGQRSGRPVEALTTSELIAQLPVPGLAADDSAALARLFATADLVKYAGQTPTADEAAQAAAWLRRLAWTRQTLPAGEVGASGENGQTGGAG